LDFTDAVSVGEVNPSSKVLEVIKQLSIGLVLDLFSKSFVQFCIVDGSSVSRFDALELSVVIFIKLWVEWFKFLQLSSED